MQALQQRCEVLLPTAAKCVHLQLCLRHNLTRDCQMSCHRCQRPLKKPVKCPECGVEYCKRVCYNTDYTRHQSSCVGSYTTQGDITYPITRGIIEELFRGGHISHAREVTTVDNPYIYIEVEVDDYVEGTPLGEDDVSIYAGRKEGFTPAPNQGCAEVTVLVKEETVASFELFFKLHGRNQVR